MKTNINQQWHLIANIIQSLSLIALVMIFSNSAFAQVNIGGTPFSKLNQIDKTNIPVQDLPALNTKMLEEEDRERELRGQPPRFAYPVNVDIDLLNSGVWTDLPNGDRIWQMTIRADEAFGLHLQYEKFEIPADGTFYILDENDNNWIGGFTSANNRSDGSFSTAPLAGKAITLEYFEPRSSRGDGVIEINRVFVAYKPFENEEKDYGDSGPCNVNVNCPAGADWQCQKRSVARYLINLSGGSFWCSGALVNNTEQDRTPYFLTANHCLGGEHSAGDAISVVFSFNYESPTCTSVNVTPNNLSGAELKATDSTSDFALFELNTAVPLSYNVFFAGWSAESVIPDEVTGIHHPSGDIKKICREDDPLTSTDYLSNSVNASSHYLRVADWDLGVTEGGSSGSPIFNDDKRIVGMLSGGYAACSGTVDNNQPDWYGKFSSAFDHSSSMFAQLKHWLDPNDEGITQLAGFGGCYGISNQDLYMRDGWLDNGDEPTPEPFIWASRDIWVRYFPDGSTQHQNPDFAEVSGAPNQVYVRVYNRGTQTSQPADLHLYWTRARSGEVWDEHWLHYSIPSAASNFTYDPIDGTTQRPLGGEITIIDPNDPTSASLPVTIPALQPGESYTIPPVDWYPPNPAWYPGGTTIGGHPMICLLARIVDPVYDPMANEQLPSNIGPNVINNNNIITRNTFLTNFKFGAVAGGGDDDGPLWVLANNPYQDLGTFDLVFSSLDTNNGNPFAEYGNIRFYFDENLWELMAQSGFEGTGFEYAGQQSLMVTDFSEARLTGIELPPGENYEIGIDFQPHEQQPQNQERFRFAFYHESDLEEELVGSMNVIEVNTGVITDEADCSIDLGGGITINEGDCVEIGQTGYPIDYSFAWEPAEWVNEPNSPLTSVCPPETTTFYLYGTDGQGNCTLEDQVLIRVDGDDRKTELAILDKLAVKAYPNPFSDEVSIEVLSDKSGTAMVRLFDAVGKTMVVQEFNVEANSNTKLNLDPGKIPAGIYFFTVTLNDEIHSGKLIKN